jgi:hypothetical protein
MGKANLEEKEKQGRKQGRRSLPVHGFYRGGI